MIVRLQITTPARIDVLLLAEIQKTAPAFSRARLKQWFYDQRVLLRGAPISAAFELGPGDIEISIRDFKPDEISPPRARPSTRGCFLPIIYEDSEVLILNKASGVPS